nr:M28 family peptidase [Allomuricauda sp.]
MKNILGLLAFVMIIGCKSTPKADGPDGLKGSLSEKAISGLTDSLRVGKLMEYLASDALMGRDSGSEGIEMAAQHIEEHFKKFGIAPYFESFRDTLTNYENTSYNIVGMVEGNDDKLKHEYIVVGAHYDHIGIITPEGDDNIANGANDNASGTVTVMELARYFGLKRTNKRSLIFALFSAEEKGLLGSDHLAKRLKGEDLNLYTMINFEMTGVPLLDKDYIVYLTGYHKSNLAEVTNAYAEEKLVGFLPESKHYNLFQRSDNYPFFKAFGVPSHTYCTFDFTNFNHYHKVGDEVELMDLGHMASLVNKMLPVVEGISNAPDQEIKMSEPTK